MSEISIETKSRYELADIDAYVALHRDGIDAALQETKVIPDSMKSSPVIRRLWEAGGFLKNHLLAHGCQEDRASEICFCHGQQSVFCDTYEVALRYLNEFVQMDDVADQPGLELADRLNRRYLGGAGADDE